MDAQIVNPADPDFMMVITIMLSSVMYDGLIRSSSCFFQARHSYDLNTAHDCRRKLRIPILFRPYPDDLIYQILKLFNLALEPFHSLRKSSLENVDLAVLLYYGDFYGFTNLAHVGALLCLTPGSYILLRDFSLMTVGISQDIRNALQIFEGLTLFSTRDIELLHDSDSSPPKRVNWLKEKLDCASRQVIIPNVLPHIMSCSSRSPCSWCVTYLEMDTQITVFPSVSLCSWCRRTIHVECAAALLIQTGAVQYRTTENSETGTTTITLNTDRNILWEDTVKELGLERKIPKDSDFIVALVNAYYCPVCLVPFGFPYTEVPRGVHPILSNNPASRSECNERSTYAFETIKNFFRPISVKGNELVLGTASQNLNPQCLESRLNCYEEINKDNVLRNRTLKALNYSVTDRQGLLREATRKALIRAFYPPQTGVSWAQFPRLGEEP